MLKFYRQKREVLQEDLKTWWLHIAAAIVLKNNHPDTDKMYQEHLLGLFWSTPRTYFSTVISHLGKTTAIFQIVQSGHNYLCASHDLCSAAHCPSTPPAMLKTLWLYKYRYETCNRMKTLIMYTKKWWHYEILWCKICKYIVKYTNLKFGALFCRWFFSFKVELWVCFWQQP